jgi:tetratricopeptide (TPR) repeat protein
VSEPELVPWLNQLGEIHDTTALAKLLGRWLAPVRAGSSGRDPRSMAVQALTEMAEDDLGFRGRLEQALIYYLETGNARPDTDPRRAVLRAIFRLTSSLELDGVCWAVRDWLSVHDGRMNDPLALAVGEEALHALAELQPVGVPELRSYWLRTWREGPVPWWARAYEGLLRQDPAAAAAEAQLLLHRAGTGAAPLLHRLAADVEQSDMFQAVPEATPSPCPGTSEDLGVSPRVPPDPFVREKENTLPDFRKSAGPSTFLRQKPDGDRADGAAPTIGMSLKLDEPPTTSMIHDEDSGILTNEPVFTGPSEPLPTPPPLRPPGSTAQIQIEEFDQATPNRGPELDEAAPQGPPSEPYFLSATGQWATGGESIAPAGTGFEAEMADIFDGPETNGLPLLQLDEPGTSGDMAPPPPPPDDIPDSERPPEPPTGETGIGVAPVPNEIPPEPPEETLPERQAITDEEVEAKQKKTKKKAKKKTPAPASGRSKPPAAAKKPKGRVARITAVEEQLDDARKREDKVDLPWLSLKLARLRLQQPGLPQEERIELAMEACLGGVRAAEAVLDRPAMLALLQLEGQIHAIAGDLKAAQSSLQAAVATCRRAAGSNLHALARIQVRLGDRSAARARFEEAVFEKRRGQPTDPHSLARSLHELGRTLADLGEVEESARVFQAAVEAHRAASDTDHGAIAGSLYALALTVGALGDSEHARQLLAQSADHIAAARPVNHRMLGAIYHRLARAAREAREPDEARGLYEKALDEKRAEKRPDRESIGRTLHGLGRVAFELNDPDSARKHLKEAVSEKEGARPPAPASLAATLVELARLERTEGDNHEALDLLERAIKSARKGRMIDRRPYLASLYELARVLAEDGDTERAWTVTQELEGELNPSSSP